MAIGRRRFVWMILSCFLGNVGAETTLQFVAVAWRHGDRAPSGGTFPTDTGNGDSTWPQGFGELTQAGMRQHQHLGDYLRKRYVIEEAFLSSNYSTKEIYIRSTSYNRTLMSALSNLAGMYPSAEADMLQGIPLWQPIPVHSQPRETDPMLWMDYPCPKAEEIYSNRVMESDAVKQIELENKEFLDFLKNKTGMQQMTLDDVWDVWDPLNCERIYNDSHTWPDWVTEEIFENLTALMHVSVSFYYSDPQIQRFRGSLLFNDIAIRFGRRANHRDDFPAELKYYVYSAHDTTLTALMENMGAFNDHLPEYATALLFELHEKTPNVSTVEVWYVNETMQTAPPVRLAVKGCGDEAGGECPLEIFVKLAGSNVPKDFDAECQLTDPTSTPSSLPICDDSGKHAATVAAIVLGVTTGVLLVAFTVLLFLYCKLKKRNRIDYQ